MNINSVFINKKIYSDYFFTKEFQVYLFQMSSLPKKKTSSISVNKEINSVENFPNYPLLFLLFPPHKEILSIE